MKGEVRKILMTRKDKKILINFDNALQVSEFTLNLTFSNGVAIES